MLVFSFRYFLSIVDGHTRFIWIFLLKSKDHTSSIFFSFKTMFVKQFYVDIKALQTEGV